MSRRATLYRSRMGKNAEETVTNILSGHGKAVGKKSGKVCSLPMKPETASRIATALHAKK